MHTSKQAKLQCTKCSFYKKFFFLNIISTDDLYDNLQIVYDLDM